MDQPLWQPFEGAHRAGQHDGVRAAGSQRTAGGCGLSARSGRGRSSIPSCSGRRCGVSRTCASRPWREVLVGGDRMPGREVVRRRRAQFRREPAAPARRPACDHRLDRRWPARQLSYASCIARWRNSRQLCNGGRRPGRSGGGGDAACRPDHHRDAGDDRARRDLVFVLPPISACRACSTASARSSPRC